MPVQAPTRDQPFYTVIPTHSPKLKCKKNTKRLKFCDFNICLNTLHVDDDAHVDTRGGSSALKCSHAKKRFVCERLMPQLQQTLTNVNFKNKIKMFLIFHGAFMKNKIQAKQLHDSTRI